MNRIIQGPKRWQIVGLTLLLIISPLVSRGMLGHWMPVANAESNFLHYESNGQVTISGYIGTATEVEIPSTIGGKTVTVIGYGAFQNKGITSVNIPNTVLTIDQFAFRGNQLTSVTIPNSVRFIQNSSFRGNQLTSVDLKDGSTHLAIYASAFADNQLTSLVIPNRVSALSYSSSFANNKLEHIILGNISSSLNGSVFSQGGPTSNFPEFVGYYIDPEFNSVWNGTTVPAGKEIYAKRLPDPPTDVSAVAGDEEATVSFTGPTHTGGNVVNNYTVTAYVYDENNGEVQTSLITTGNASPITVTGLTNGTEYTFKVIATNAAGNSVVSAASDPVTAVGIYEATENSDGTVTITKYNGSATEVEIPGEINGKTVSRIGVSVFFNKQLTSVTIPESVKSIESAAFTNNQLTSVTLPNNLNFIGFGAFEGNSLTSITIPENASIEGRAFYNNALTSVTIPEGVTSIGGSAFYGNELTSVTIPGSVTSIGNFAFFNNQLTSVTIENGVTTIGSGAFSRSTEGNKLTAVTIPESVTTIGPNAFSYNQLERITFKGNPITIGNGAFLQTFEEFKGWYTDSSFTSEWDGTSVPAEGEVYAKRTPNPPKEVNPVVGDAKATVSFTGPTHTGGNAVTDYTVKVFVDGTQQTDLQTTGTASPITVTGLTNGTAYTFKVIAKNSAGDSMASDESIAVSPVATFETEIDEINGTNVTIKKYNGTETEVEIPDEIDGKKVTTIGANAFEGKGLTSVSIPSSVTTIGDRAFSNNQLTSVTIPVNVTSIGESAFAENQLTSVTIPENVSEIKANAFANNLLELVTFNGNPSIGDNAFNQDTTVFPEFVGWYTDESLETEWDGTTVPAGKELYAKRTPSSPKEVSAVVGDAKATVSFTGPTHTGGNAVTSYTVKVYVDGEEQTELAKTGTASPITVTGLTNGTAYTFKVIATNAAGESVVSSASAAVTPIKSSSSDGGSTGGGGGSGSSPTPVEEPKSPITFPTTKETKNVKVTVTVEKDETGTEVTVVKLDREEFKKQLAENKEAKALVIPVDSNSSKAKAILQVRDVEDAAANNKENVFIVKANGAEYSLPATLINSPDVAAGLGISQEDAPNAEVEVTIEERPASVVKVGNSKLASKVVDFTITVTSGNNTLELNNFGNTYVDRALDLTQSVSSENAVGVVVSVDGTISPVPTQFVDVDGKKVAVLKRNSNSLYTVVSNDVDFTDISNHWAKENILLLGNKLIVNGYKDDSFKPNGTITRGEFVTIIARSLGLDTTDTNIEEFSDVTSNNWYAGALKAVTTHNLVGGFNDGTFKANEKITRQDAAVIIARVIDFLELQSNKQAKVFNDEQDISSYAKDAIEKATKLDIINGYNDNSFKPKASITRAEAVKMIENLLDNANFISK